MQAIIPRNHPFDPLFRKLASGSRIVIISGLPGVGKSLYVNEFYRIAENEGKNVTVIQWDIARKSFETPENLRLFPMIDGEVHAGFKLMVGKWLLDFIERWLSVSSPESGLLLIEAPLVGHRMVEVVSKNIPASIAAVMESRLTTVVVPIPTTEVRQRIEHARSRDVDDDAVDWKGAKPSVLLKIWQDVYRIGVKMGYRTQLAENSYDPGLYEFVFRQVCRHRKMVPILVKDAFEVQMDSEDALHKLESAVPDKVEVGLLRDWVLRTYSDEEIMKSITDMWHLQ